MGYSRAGNRRTVYLIRANYTNFGDPNTDYYFNNNGSSGSLTVQLKSFSGNYHRGDRIKIGHFGGGTNDFPLTVQNPDAIRIGLSANTTIDQVDYNDGSISVTKNAPIEITWMDYTGFLRAVVTEKAE